jgi:hypothetical protein
MAFNPGERSGTDLLVALYCCIDAEVCLRSVPAIFVGSFCMLYNDREFTIFNGDSQDCREVENCFIICMNKG